MLGMQSSQDLDMMKFMYLDNMRSEGWLDVHGQRFYHFLL